MIQPINVKIAICIYFATIGLSFIGAILNYVATVPKPPLLSVVLIWGILYGLLIGLGYAIQARKNWARHLNALITVVSLVTVFMAGISPLLVTSVSNIILIVNNIAAVSVLVLLYSAPANTWFK
jgi:hypothetical protein